MTSAPRSRWGLAVGGALLLGVAMPPAVVPGAEFLVLLGLMAWFALATSSGRPLLTSYLYGCVFMAWFSWSVRHVLLPAYVAIVVVGGLYFVLGTLAVRGWPAKSRAVGFAVAVAATFWLRAVMPEICYPHGQPCHCLWQWPMLLGALPLGGEPLGNALLGGLAAAGVGVWRSWRVAQPPWGASWRGFGAWLFLSLCVSLPGALEGDTFDHERPPPAKVRIAAIEPGLHPDDSYAGLALEAQRQLYSELLEERLFAPTRALLAEPDPPDVILWPESSLPVTKVPAADLAAGRARLLPHQFRASRTRLVVGANIERDSSLTPAAFAIRLPDGIVLGHHEKQCLVPGGEFLPFVHWLPASVSAWVHDAFEKALGTAPDCIPGTAAPLLTTADGTKFGVLLCYDNAFPEPAAAQVEAGAQFLCVVSNEAWYRGGAELWQLVAMTVCRAIELRTPIVRCTTDGWTLHVDAHGRIGENLPVEPSPHAGARILRCEVQPDPQRQLPMAWHRAAVGPLAAVLLAVALLHGAWLWARLRVPWTAP